MAFQSEKGDLIEGYEQLMAVSQNLAQTGHYEAAFHALQAALHCAEDLKSEHCLAAVQQEAGEQRDSIDKQYPEHRMSMRSTQQRGGSNLYDILIRQANVHINQIKHERRQHRMSHLPKRRNF